MDSQLRSNNLPHAMRICSERQGRWPFEEPEEPLPIFNNLLKSLEFYLKVGIFALVFRFSLNKPDYTKH
jgi:hypothetical protein